MIKKAIITAIVLLAMHALFVSVSPISSSQYAWQQNAVKAQKFAYENTHENVIIGSSLSNRLVMDSLQGVTNLSFAGQGIFDGLSILTYHKKMPKNIFIETNIMTREEDENFTSYINSPILSPIKKVIPSLRDEHQPVAMLGEMIINKLEPKKSNSVVQENTNKSEGQDDTFFNKLLKRQADEFNVLPDTTLLHARFEDLENNVQTLKANGVNVVFFEMPVNESICDLPEPQLIRKFYNRYFPETSFQYIRVPNCSGYRTTDGAHLTHEEALRYTQFFKLNVETLLTEMNK